MQSSSAPAVLSVEPANSPVDSRYSSSAFPRVKRVKRDVFGPSHGGGKYAGQRDTGIIPLPQLEASGDMVERCGVCLRVKAHCAC